ncbi:MAG: GPR endopeptidase [Oscillospiraceae bacterium]|nr:GPR endopeptidase [Oscillospiraceae bacterium]
MNFRTDLALECREPLETLPEGLRCDEESFGEIRVTRVIVENEKGARALGKPPGRYVTLELPPLGEYADVYGEALDACARELRRLLPPEGAVLVAGLGNDGVTPDALGPRCCSLVQATRHIGGELARSAGLGDLRPVACLAPGVLGRTGMESGEHLAAVARKLKPAALIVVDALAARRLSRLGRTVQLSDSGIVPGSGVGNARQAIQPATLGIPVISIGVPTVVDAATLAFDLLERRGLAAEPEREPEGGAEGMMVTPREVDLVVDRAARLISMAINCALQPHLEPEDFLALTA